MELSESEMTQNSQLIYLRKLNKKKNLTYIRLFIVEFLMGTRTDEYNMIYALFVSCDGKDRNNIIKFANHVINKHELDETKHKELNRLKHMLKETHDCVNILIQLLLESMDNNIPTDYVDF